MTTIDETPPTDEPDPDPTPEPDEEVSDSHTGPLDSDEDAQWLRDSDPRRTPTA